MAAVHETAPRLLSVRGALRQVSGHRGPDPRAARHVPLALALPLENRINKLYSRVV
jgi:hypothetical protein